MKYPKHRANLYVVVREEPQAVVGSFEDLDLADEFVGVCTQEWRDKVGLYPPAPTFKVVLTTFYAR